MSNQNILLQLIQPISQSDPRLYDILRKMLEDMAKYDAELFPPIGPSIPQTTIPQTVPDVTVFGYNLKLLSVQLYWSAPSATILRYEIRQGNVWDTANSILTTDSLSAEIDPLPIGTTRFLIKAIGESGVYSTNAAFVDVVVPPIGIISISSQVIDNNVLLYWNQPNSTFKVDYYIVKKDGVEVGTISGTFFTIFESVSGTYTYSIIAVDVAGNQSAEYSVSATVAQPPDYELQADYTSLLLGTRTNAYKSGTPPRLLVCVNTTETWQQHFTSRGWNTIQDQINAGYPYYAQPAMDDASYEEVIDYGLVISNTVATPSYNTNLITGSGVTTVVKMAYSLDNISYSSFFVVTSSLFIPTLRYLKVRIEFTSVD